MATQVAGGQQPASPPLGGLLGARGGPLGLRPSFTSRSAAARAAAAAAAELQNKAANLLASSGMASVIAANPFLADQLTKHALAAFTPMVGPTIHPDVQELADHFQLDDRITKRLDDTMRLRASSFETDMLALYEILETARNPPGLLSVKIKEMEEGVFLGKGKPDPDVQEVARKYKLDDQAAGKLTEVLKAREASRKEDLALIERHLEVSNRPSAMVMMMIGKLRKGEPLGEPDRKGGGGDSKDARRHVEPSRRAEGDRERERDRERRSQDREPRGHDRDGRRSRSRDRRRRSRS